MRHYLRLSSLLLLFLASCSTPYKGLQGQKSTQSIYEYQPEFTRVLYRCIVDGRIVFKKFHLSGVLFFKQLENGTKRAIFQNEMGIAFFDFEWDKDGNFKKRHMMPQMDKEAVVKTLRKDLEMLMLLGIDKESEIVLLADGGKQQLHRLNRDGAYVYYTVENQKIVKIENINNRKRVVSVDVEGSGAKRSMGDSILFNHHKANFTISLTKIDRNVNE